MTHRKTRPRPIQPKISIPEGAVAVFELTTGQSSVELVTDSKGMVKPSVHVYHRDPDTATELAQRLFDDLLVKYVASAREAA